MNHVRWPQNGLLAQWILDQFERGYLGHAIDVGASDGMSINTTWALEKVHHWTVLSVEANPEFLPMLLKERAFVASCACGNEPGDAVLHVHEQHPEAFTSLRPQPRPDLHPIGDMTWKKIPVQVRTVDQLLASWEFPKLDALCVDVEGTELDVLKGCDLARWKPRVVVSECWDKVGPVDLYLESFGYVKTARCVHNDVFILPEKF